MLSANFCIFAEKCMRWNDNIFRLFDILRFPLVILIVFLHCKGTPVFCPIDWQHFGVMDGYTFLRHYLSNVISCVSVPTFFLMSGYLFYYRLDFISLKLYKEKILRRLKSLLVPYFFWNTLFLVGIIFFEVRNSECTNMCATVTELMNDYGGWRVYWDCQLMEGEFDIPIGFAQDNSAPLLVPMWFVRDLWVVCLFSPALWWLIKKIGIAFVSLLAVCYIFQFWPYLHGISSVSFFFFSLGIYMCMHSNKMETFFQDVGRFILIATTLLSLVLVFLTDIQYIYQPYILRGFAILGSLTALYLSYMCLGRKTVCLERLSKASFVIYAAHMVFISKYVKILICRFVPSENVVFLMLEYVMVPIITSCICIIIYIIVRKYIPNMILFLNGGR